MKRIMDKEEFFGFFLKKRLQIIFPQELALSKRECKKCRVQVKIN
jgi:hypothetical protein